MAKKPTRVRDAGTGQIVAPSEAEKRPKETVTEPAGKSALEKRVALLESVLNDDGGRIGDLYRRRKHTG
jgi:hypothetical protein